MLSRWPGRKERPLEPVVDLPEGVPVTPSFEPPQTRGAEARPSSVAAPRGVEEGRGFVALKGAKGLHPFRSLVPEMPAESGFDRLCLTCLKRIGPSRILIQCETHGCAERERGESALAEFVPQLDELRCLTCHQASSRLYCPDCRSRLPSLPVRDLSHVIALVGLRSSGKTVYLAALLKELEGSLARLGISVTTRRHQTQLSADQYWRELFIKRQLPQPTQVGNLEPLILWLSRHVKGSEGTVEEQIPLVLYDPPGEMFEKDDFEQRELLTLARGIVALIDVSTSHTREATHRPTMVIQHLIRDLTRVHRMAGHESSEGLLGCGVRLAVTLSKVDTLMGRGPGYFANPDFVRQGSPITKSLPSLRADLVQIQRECREALERLKQEPLLTLAENHFVTGYFGVSALGAGPLYRHPGGEVNEKVPPIELRGLGPEDGPLLTMLHPVRVVDPILWMLDDIGFLEPKPLFAQDA